MQTESTPIQFDEVGLRKHFLTLTNTQKEFVKLVVKWSKRPRKMLVVVSGGPGTGKSYVVKNTLDCLQVKQLRMSYTARSAVAIGGQTIHSAIHLNFRGLCLDLEKQLSEEEDLVTAIKASGDIVQEFHYDEYPLVVVIDEVSMVNGWLMYWIIRFFMDRTNQPLLFITSGDRHQLNPVKSIHNLFSFTFSEGIWVVRIIHLKESKRFLPAYEKIINTLRTFVDSANESGLFAFICQHFPIQERIEGDLLSQANRAMAAKNDRVIAFNTYYIKNMVKGPEIKIEENLILKHGCIVFVTKNGCSSVSNGTELEFICYNRRRDRIICKNPKTREEVVIRKDALKQFPVVLGFAATIHKFQGDTIDNSKIVIHFDGNRNLNMAYTALSRVRDVNQILAIAL